MNCCIKQIYMKRITKALIRLHRSAGWYDPLWFSCIKARICPFQTQLTLLLVIPPANFVCRGYTVFTLSVRPSVRASVRPCVCPSVRPSVTLCFLNNSKSHCWIFIKPCKHVHICKTNTLDKKVRARGQFY